MSLRQSTNQRAPASKQEPPPTLALSRFAVRRLMSLADYLTAVQAGFRALAEQSALAPAPLHLPAAAGAFHAKGAIFGGVRRYGVLKFNSNFPLNPRTSGLPTIQGVIVLCDADDGRLLAILDSQEITLRRTAAASVLAAGYLARAEATTLAICGCGEQGRAHLEAFAQAFALRRVYVWDLDADRARRFAQDMQAQLGLAVEAASTAAEAVRACDIAATCTTASAPFLGRDDVRPGTFIAAVGTDSAQKSELAPSLLADATIVADVLSQCALMGDLHQAIEAGVLSATDVHADLAELVAGRKLGRTRGDEITIFDSTGTAITDAASAALIYERAVARGVGSSIELADE